MRDKLLKKIHEYKYYIIEIDKQQKECKICNNTGIVNKKINLKFMNTNINTYCKCQEYKGMYRFEYNELIEESENKVIRIKNEIPFEYQNIEYNNVNFIKFMQSEKIFCWITGATGVGKTAMLYSRKIYEINKNIYYKRLEIIREIDFNYDTYTKGLIAIDDVGVEENKENRYKYLINYYYDLIDKKRNQNEKCIFTSNLKLNEWIKLLHKYDKFNADRIASRLSIVTDIIELKGEDRRKII